MIARVLGALDGVRSGGEWMKIVLGIDLQQAYVPALHLVAKLGFKNPELLLVQTSPTVDSMLPAFPIDGATIDLFQSTYKEAGEAALHDAEAEAKKLGLNESRYFAVGPSAELLNEYAEREGADMIAVRTTHHGAWQSEFMGSVTRAVLLCGRVSVLVAKQGPRAGKRLSVVFATDGSQFNERCLDRFLAMHPSEIEAIHVVSAWGLASHVEEMLRRALHHSPDLDAELQSSAQAAAEQTAQRFVAAGYTATGEAVRGAPDKVLHDAMTQSGADLLVVGAHGKNWIERLLMGSTSLHQVINEPYNVLVLRP
ncbi:MAG: universal stress protein [Fimbriimonadaceae bacterium]